MIRRESTGKKCGQMIWRLAKWDAKPHLAFLTSSNVDLPSNEQTLLGISKQPLEQCCKENGSWFIFSTESGFCFYRCFWPAAPITFSCGGSFQDVAFGLPSQSGPISHFPSPHQVCVSWGGQVWVPHKVRARRSDASIRQMKQLQSNKLTASTISLCHSDDGTIRAKTAITLTVHFLGLGGDWNARATSG